MAFKVRNEGEDPLARRYRDPFEFNTLDFGIAGGIGTQMAISEAITVKAELLYTWGIRSVNKTSFYNPTYGIGKPGGMTSQAISVCVGLGFPYGKTGG